MHFTKPMKAGGCGIGIGFDIGAPTGELIGGDGGVTGSGLAFVAEQWR